MLDSLNKAYRAISLPAALLELKLVSTLFAIVYHYSLCCHCLYSPFVILVLLFYRADNNVFIPLILSPLLLVSLSVSFLFSPPFFILSRILLPMFAVVKG